MTMRAVKKGSFSERFYRQLILIYPKEFRRLHGQEMVQTFRDYQYEVLQQAGSRNTLGFWGLILYDLVTTAFIEHGRAVLLKLQQLLGIEKEQIILNTLLHLNVAAHTDIGRTRKSNEDKVLSFVPKDEQVMQKKGALFVVADGLGGHTKGDLASEMTVNIVRDTYYQEGDGEVEVALRKAVELANKRIYESNAADFPEETAAKKMGMGSTCVAAVLKGDHVYVANVGDSRAYIVRNNQITQISQDHTPEDEEVRAGKITREEARAKRSNVITRCLGSKADVAVDTFIEPVQNGDILVLCTDGLSSLLSDEEIRTIVEQYGPEESVSHLIVRANEQGGPDNISAVVAHVSLTDA